MRHQFAEFGFFHVRLVDVIWGKIAGNSCEHVDITFRDSLGKLRPVANFNMKSRGFLGLLC